MPGGFGKDEFKQAKNIRFRDRQAYSIERTANKTNYEKCFLQCTPRPRINNAL